MMGPVVPDGEDCLYLDVTVPSVALKSPEVKLPIVDWIYGGAYSKFGMLSYMFGD
jgi:carboxylesterase type B